MNEEIRQRTKWFMEDRFGMFIHWGLYSVAAGQWNGKDIDGIGEWIQNFAKIPNSEYNKLTEEMGSSGKKSRHEVRGTYSKAP